MKCIIKSLLLSIFALFAVLFGSCIITSSDVSAVADYSYIINSSNSSSGAPLCGGSSGRTCSDYSYIYITSSSVLSSVSQYQYIKLRVQYGSDWYDQRLSPLLLPFLSTSISSFNYFGLVVNPLDFSLPSDVSITITLSESNPLSSCPPVEPCPEIPENPYDNKFDEIKQAILIIPATALVIYFFFCIYRMLLKGRE